MRLIQRLGRGGLVVGLVATIAGLVLVVGSAVAAGDWWLAREPWIGLGLTLTVLGLAGTGAFFALLDLVEPVGWTRILALPPALLVGAFWAFALVLGLPDTGGIGVRHNDVRTTLYSVPQLLVVVLVTTLLIGLPLVIPRRRTPQLS
jgi:hypothetical protein